MPEPTAQPAAPGHRPLGELLLERGLVSASELQQARGLKRRQGGSLARILVELGAVDPGEVLKLQAARLDVPLLRPQDFPSDPPREDGLPASYMRRYRFVPLGGSPQLRVAVSDPLDFETLGTIRDRTGKQVRIALAAESDILAVIDRVYGTATPEEEAPSPADRDRLRDVASEEPAIRYVNSLIAQALQDRASDIHLEPLEHGFRVRCRIDGRLEERRPPPPEIRLAAVSRLKVMAKLNIAEHRMPQDGRIPFRALGRSVDLRVATLPTLHGESVAVRLLDPEVAGGFDLAALGLGDRLLDRMDKLSRLSRCLVLATGPTGSGKTTTLHALLKQLNSPERKIVTIEDPVEYRLDGVSQIEARPGIGLTFAAGLRHIVRQDPDAILVGEIRDGETAAIAIRSALTGHAVYSTLHTNDAAGSVTRLVDMGIEPYLLAASLSAVLAQRLVRRLCPSCRRRAERVTSPEGRRIPTWRPEGCQSCRGRGYAGRTGLFELLEIDGTARRIIASGGPELELRAAAAQAGMRSLVQDGWDKVEAGVTSVAEVVRTLQESG